MPTILPGQKTLPPDGRVRFVWAPHNRAATVLIEVVTGKHTPNKLGGGG
jgi:hypothetical protein